MANNMVVPPGGFQGFSQMAPASQRALFPGGGRSPKRRKAKSSSRRTTKRAKSARGKRAGRKIKFGSPAWRKKYKLGKKKGR